MVKKNERIYSSTYEARQCPSSSGKRLSCYIQETPGIINHQKHESLGNSLSVNWNGHWKKLFSLLSCKKLLLITKIVSESLATSLISNEMDCQVAREIHRFSVIQT